MIKWWKQHFVWKYVGHIVLQDGNEFFYWALYMTESGRRKPRKHTWGKPADYAYEARHTYTHITQQLKLWKKGGPFPAGLNYDEDTLGSMLNRMINKKLGV